MSSPSDASSARGGTSASLGGCDSPPRRALSLYDAVAGRATRDGFAAEAGRSTFLATAVSPEDVLFRRKGAPDRDTARDPYWADGELAPHQRLPDSDLLKALHAYAADFYDRATPDRGLVGARSLDETALLALGVLMEESMADVLGETGDLALVEGEPVTPRDGSERDGSGMEIDAADQEAEATASPRQRTGGPHATKKRKIDLAAG